MNFTQIWRRTLDYEDEFNKEVKESEKASKEFNELLHRALYDLSAIDVSYKDKEKDAPAQKIFNHVEKAYKAWKGRK